MRNFRNVKGGQAAIEYAAREEVNAFLPQKETESLPHQGLQPLVLHVPHASTHFPFMDGFTTDYPGLGKEILKLTDWYTDELFYTGVDLAVIAGFSRIFCDVERFVDDSQEIMAKFGMGVLYERSDEGQPLRRVDQLLRDQVVNGYYLKHHRMFSELVQNQLSLHGKVLIVDCHSFPDQPLQRDLDQHPDRPDFNIGTDEYHTPDFLKEVSTDFFLTRGFTVAIDRPYKGSIVPMDQFQKEKNVRTIMLEINRRLYLNDGTNEKSACFGDIQRVTKDYLELVRSAHAGN